MAIWPARNRSVRSWRRLAERTGIQARSARGSATVELAVVAPLLVLMAIGVADFGRVCYTAIVLSHAARAGAQYGAQTNGTTGDADGIQDAAEREAVNIGPIEVASQRICECPNSGVVACTTTICAGYGVPQVFVEVTTTTTFETLAPYPGIPTTVPLSRTAKVRRQ
jgi:Flp pilus assembly protein TadG